jgi:hypothetical protein
MDFAPLQKLLIKLPLVRGQKPKLPQASAEMQARIERWLRGLPLTFQSVQALLPDVPGCERLLRSKGIQEVPEPIVPGIIGDARVDGLLIEWFNEHRMPELRHEDAEREHEHRDLLAQLGVGVRPYKGPRPRDRR